jgi:peptidoglycan/LPS O-acetylase OafA/YrhL
MSGTTSTFDTRRNNLEFVRFSLAVLVILSHSFPLATGSETNEPFILATHGQTTGGTIAVNLFFVLSGFLIANSFLSSRSLWSYLSKRVRRIYPGFIVTMLVGALLVAPLASASSPFHTAGARVGNFVLSCLRLREFDYLHAFASNPAPGAINGSLWSISYEFWCYIGVAVLGLVGILQRRSLVLGIFCLSLVVSFLFAIKGWAPGGSFLGAIFGYPPFWARLLPMYLAGVVFFLHRDRIPHRGYIAAGALGVLVVAAYIPLAWAVCFPLAGTYLLFWFGYHPGIRLVNFGNRGDFSYGTYLYAFPIQQLVMRFVGHQISPYLLSAIAAPLTLMAAILSWHMVEKRFVGSSAKVRRTSAIRQPSPQVAALKHNSSIAVSMSK